MLATAGPHTGLDAFLNRHPTVQALPDNTMRILRMVNSPTCSIAQLQGIIAQDAALAGGILKAVNSSYYGLQARITRLDRAIALLGLRSVKELVLAGSLGAVCGEDRLGRFTARDLWDHCVGTAVLAREFAAHAKGFDPEEAFIAVMLQDIAMLLICQSEPQEAAAVIAAVERGEQPYIDAESSHLGFDHCTLGERLAENWQFPAPVAAVIRWHHAPDASPIEHRALCSLAYVADTLCSRSGIGCGLTCALQEVSALHIERVGLTAERVATVVERLPILMRLHLH